MDIGKEYDSLGRRIRKKVYNARSGGTLQLDRKFIYDGWNLLADIEAPKNIDGISFLPAMLGEKQKQHKYLYWEFHERGGRQAVRMGKWKAVRLKVKENPDAPIELYNLETDIGEEDDIAAEHPEIAVKMKKIMKEARTSSEDWPFHEKQIAKS